jgi:hypothetical protein
VMMCQERVVGGGVGDGRGDGFVLYVLPDMPQKGEKQKPCLHFRVVSLREIVSSLLLSHFDHRLQKRLSTFPAPRCQTWKPPLFVISKVVSVR